MAKVMCLYFVAGEISYNEGAVRKKFDLVIGTNGQFVEGGDWDRARESVVERVRLKELGEGSSVIADVVITSVSLIGESLG